MIEAYLGAVDVTRDPGVLDVRGLHAGYDGVPVVRDLDLHVDAGEVVALLGPNGAGKTTTLLTVSGLLPRSPGPSTCSAGDRRRPAGPRRWPAGAWPTCPSTGRCSPS